MNQKIVAKLQEQKLSELREIMNVLRNEKEVIYHIKSKNSILTKITLSPICSFTVSPTSINENAHAVMTLNALLAENQSR